MMYIPKLHRGTSEQIINSLLNEAEEICRSGTMRGRAKDREMNRISAHLKELGVETLLGQEKDEGFLLFLQLPHESGCQIDRKNGLCRCKKNVLRRIESYF